jgi:hypothetical protein
MIRAVVHIYEFEVSEIHRDDIKHPSIIYARGRYGSPTVIGVISTSAIKASIEILDMGYTPVKLLNPKQHD